MATRIRAVGGYNRDRYDDYTVHFGGPVIRDRAWIYANYQYLQDWDTQPGADPQFPRKFGAPPHVLEADGGYHPERQVHAYVPR